MKESKATETHLTSKTLIEDLKEKILSPIPLMLIALFAIGLLIRCANVGDIIFYWDEPLHTVRIAHQPLSYVAEWNNGSAFFSLLVHFLLPLGKMEVMSRIASVIFGSLSIIAVFFFGKVLISRKAGLIAAAFVTFSPFLIQYSQQSRMYATYCFFSILTAYFVFRAVTEDRIRFYAGYSLAALLNVYNHIFGLLVIPVFSLWAVIVWLKTGFHNRGKTRKPFAFLKLFKFAGWTFLALITVAIFYIPDKNIQSYLSVSVNRAAGIMSKGAASFGMIGDILQDQFRAASTGFFWIFLGFAALGFLTKFKDRFMECLFSLLYMLIPFVVFILIKPNEVTALSADRYFLFFLPVLFIFMGQGILTFTNGFLFFFRRLKPPLFQKPILKSAAAILILFFLLGKGFDTKAYYINYWRLGAPKIDTEVRKHLENHLKKDSFVFIDKFPASSMVIAINPMTRNLKRSEMEYTIRKNLVVEEEKNPVMFLTMNPNLLKYFAADKIDLWVISGTRKEGKESLRKALDLIPDTTLYLLEKNWLIAFQDPQMPLHTKWLQAVNILSRNNENKAKAKDYHYLASRSHLFGGNFKEFSEEFFRAQNIKLSPEENQLKESPFFLNSLDHLWNLKPRDLREKHYERFHKALSHLLLIVGDDLRDQGDLSSALEAYRSSAELDTTTTQQVSLRLGFLANKIFRNGPPGESIPYYEEAIRLNPQRSDLMFMMAQAFFQTGRTEDAKKAYQNAFGLEPLPLRIWRILTKTDPLVLVWKKNNTYFLLFRSQKGSTLRGDILSERKIKNIEKHLFVKRDKISLEKNNLHLDLTTHKGMIKMISFQSSGKSGVTFDLWVNNAKKIRNIVIVNTGQNPASIPFSLR